MTTGQRARYVFPRLNFDMLARATLFVVALGCACIMPAQSDTYWHLRAGQEIWATGHVSLVDHYSHTAAGQPWPDHEWLWQVLAYGFFRIGGMVALTLLSAAMVTMAMVLAYRLMRGSVNRRIILAALALPLSTYSWALRPQTASLLALALVLHVLVTERFRWLPLIFLIWSNMHGAVVLGGVVLMTATAAAGWSARAGVPEDRRRFRDLLLLTPACGLLTAVTPMGVGLWRFVGASIARSRAHEIVEWSSAFSFGVVEIGFWAWAAAFVVGLTWRKRTTAISCWSDRVLAAAGLVLLPLAAMAGRNIPFFLLAAVPAVSRLLMWAVADRVARHDDRPRLNAAILGVVSVLAVGAVALAWAKPLDRLGWRPVSAAAAAAVRACPGRLYNRYGDGGFLIWFVPEVPVFVDSRQDPYPDELMRLHLRSEATGDYHEVFDRYQIGCAALPPESATVAQLVSDGWDVEYRDDRWVVLAPNGNQTRARTRR